jgi:hypothetical protein
MTDAPNGELGGVVQPPPAGNLADWVLPGSVPVTLGQIARQDPRLAAALLPPEQPRPGDLSGHGAGSLALGNLLTFDACPAFMWKIIPICATFVSTEPKTIPAQVASLITRDLWVRKITYTVRRPNAFAGSIFKAQSDHFNALNPNVDFNLLIRSYFEYVIASDPTPLETIGMVFECVCPIGFVLGCAASIEATFTLLRALAEDEIPYNVCIVFHTITLPRQYNIGLDLAITALASRGVCCG